MEGERIAAMSSDEEEGEPAGGAAAMEEAEGACVHALLWRDCVCVFCLPDPI